ncbi:MAG: hypothetical protein EOP06_01865 [Proteobacteria bacterium]|nr:MAG: hypothetical protein EOP06_01865 [Pseudomonadota bacterium]
MNASKFFFITSALMTSGCATTKTERIIRDMVIAGAVGVAIAQQRDSNRIAYSTMYGSMGAAGAAAIGLYVHNPEGESKRLERENTYLKAKLNQEVVPRLEQTTPATFAGRIPDKYSRLVNPGQWRIYSIDQWAEDGENRIIHQDKIMELIPPSLIPGAGTTKGSD